MKTLWKLWGIEFCGADGRKIIIGGLWHYEFMHLRKYYDGEPPRALLFMTRRQAREWCVKYGEQFIRADGRWRFRPVRVIESVETAK